MESEKGLKLVLTFKQTGKYLYDEIQKHSGLKRNKHAICSQIAGDWFGHQNLLQALYEDHGKH